MEPAQAAKRGRPKGAASAEKAAAAVSPSEEPAKAVRRTRRSSEEVAAAKAAKAAAGAPKQKGMSPEHMARIREARMAKRAADIAAGLIPAPKPKPAQDPNAAKMSREEVMAKARAARLANLAAKKAEKDKG